MADETEKPKTDTALPSVEAPSISPAETAVEAPAELAASAEPAAASLSPATAAQPGFWTNWFTPRLAVLAISVVLAGALGGVFGALATGAKPKDIAAEHERHAMQEALARLTKDIASVKAELTSANQLAKAQTARVAELDTRLREKLTREEATVTGSIAAPATTAPAAASAPAPIPTAMPATIAHAPLPPARPALQHASARDGIATGWSVLGMRQGFVYVRSGRDVYRVAPGARLPGLGVVEDIRREGGEWVVFTRRGVIVASRDRY